MPLQTLSMGVNVAIQLDGVDLTKFGEALNEYMTSESFLMAGAEGVRGEVDSHFVEKDSKGNKRGFPRTHYWGTARKSMSLAPGGDTATVNISQPGVALHYYGGTVLPVKGKYLTIPMTPEAANKPAPDFGDLQFVFFGSDETGSSSKGVAALIDEDGVTQFLLVRKTVHKPDLTVLPPDDQMKSAAVANFVKLIERFQPPQIKEKK